MNQDTPTKALKPIIDVRNKLGEGPFWCGRDQSLYWVDIVSAQLWKWNSLNGELSHWQMPDKVSAVFTTESNKLAVVLKDEVALFNPVDGSLQTLCKLDTDRPQNRSNDAKVSPDGSLWVGTMDDNEQQKSGRLWRVTTSGERHCILDNIGIANTLAWDTNRGIFYFADSMEASIYSFPYPDFEDVRHNRKAFVTVAAPAAPDGSALDSEGCLWNAQWDGGKVVQYSPDGSIKSVINLPVQRPTSCCFGGPNGNTLFITSASMGLSEEQLKDQPQAGSVFAIEVGAIGAPGTPFSITADSILPQESNDST